MKKYKSWYIIIGGILFACTSIFVYQHVKAKRMEAAIISLNHNPVLSSTSSANKNVESEIARKDQQIEVLTLINELQRAKMRKMSSAIPTIIFALLFIWMIYMDWRSRKERNPEKLIDEIGSKE